jgi:hypothetical protein
MVLHFARGSRQKSGLMPYWLGRPMQPGRATTVSKWRRLSPSRRAAAAVHAADGVLAKNQDQAYTPDTHFSSTLSPVPRPHLIENFLSLLLSR